MARRNKRPRLVTQYLEGVSRDVVEKYSDHFKSLAEGRHGIYALYEGDDLYYVGLATNLRGRMRSHLKDRHGESWDRFSAYLTIDGDNIRELEALLLRILKAKGNKQKGNIRGAENLGKRLARDVRRQHRMELDQLLGRKRRVEEESVHVREGRSAVLAQIARSFGKAMWLRAIYKRKEYRARLRRNGTVRFAGRNFDSPRDAAEAACGKPINGYWFWRIERSPGNWTRLSDLRGKV